MDFFQREEKARKHTGYLVFLFALAIIGIVASVYLVVAIFVMYEMTRNTGQDMYQSQQPYNAPSPYGGLWNPPLFDSISLFVLAIVIGGFLVKQAELRQGGVSIASMLSARPVNINTTDADERKLLNIVEEMSIASGAGVPQVFVMDDEDGINACAAGYSRGDTVVIVSHGAISQLTRDELQGVIGHEFSHILNGDMKLNMRLLALIFGIICIAEIGRILVSSLRYSRGSSRGGSGLLAIAAFGLAIMAVGGIGVFFGKLIQAAISRQREFLADASSVQFTRNPGGITGALKKIGGYASGSYLNTAKAPQASHFFFGDPVAYTWFSSLFATHPPLAERIKAIDPSFSGEIPSYTGNAEGALPLSDGLSNVVDANSLYFQGSQTVGRSAAIPAAAYSPTPNPSSAGGIAPLPAALVANVGQPDQTSLSYAAALHAGLPQPILDASRETVGAGALIFGLLISTDAAPKEQQLRELSVACSPVVYKEITDLLPVVSALPERSRLPVADLCIPALRQLSKAQYQQFRSGIDMLVQCDHQLDFFEFVLQKIVVHNLDAYFFKTRPQTLFNSIQSLAPDCALVLSMFAFLTDGSPEHIQAAFKAGLDGLALAPGTVVLADQSQCSLDRLDKSLLRLSQASLDIKKSILEAASRVVLAEGSITDTEFEMIRALSSSLECPMPPTIGQPAS